MLRRIMGFLLVLLLLFCTACNSGTTAGKREGNQSKLPTGSINVPYCANDYFNPFLVQTNVNRWLASLIYEPLFLIDDANNAINLLAKDYTVSGKTCTVNLKKASFTDGSPLTANDVTYSFNLAKNSSARYAAQLISVLSATVTDSDTIAFECSKQDNFMQNLLTFPIIKSGSDKLADSNNAYKPPIGTGRFYINDDMKSLSANLNWHKGSIAIATVKLVNTPDKEALSHSVEVGAVDMYYTDLSDCNILRMSGSRMNVSLNNLVYLGVNLNSSYLSNEYLRHAISSAINRNAICEEAFYTNAVSATGVFNPYWQPVEKIQTIQPVSKNEIAIENIDKIGYNNKDAQGYYLNDRGNRISLRLLVNNENAFRVASAKLIVKQLAAVGIEVIVEGVSYQKYVSRLQSKSFDLYLAEVNILDNMDMTELLCFGGSAAYGITENTNQNSLQSIIYGYYNGVNTINDIAASAISEMPIIPICYKTGVLFYSDKVDNFTNAYKNDIYYSVDKINLK